MSDPITVLVVDDSAFMRKMVTQILSQDGGLCVIGQARDGVEALVKLDALRPAVVTLDIEMPVMDGLTTLGEIMARRPTPVVMLSSLTQAGADVTLRCLERGAVDFVGKPSGSISLDIEKVGAELAAKVKVAARARLTAGKPSTPRPHPVDRPKSVPTVLSPTAFGTADGPPRVSPGSPGPKTRGKVLFVGASTGGPRALQTLIPALPADLGVPLVIVQHMPPGFTASLAKRLDAESAFHVREAADGDTLQPGVALVAPGGKHLVFDAQGFARLSDEPPVHGVRPAVDVTLASLTRLHGPRLVAVLLTGMGRDGARGLKTLHDLGGQTFAEDESTCAVYGMPKAAQELGGVGRLLPLPNLAAAVADAFHAPVKIPA